MLVACGGNGTGGSSSERQAAVDDRPVPCSIDGAADLAPVCLVERTADALIVRHPDGRFQRFHILTDGRGVESADGAEPALVTPADNGQIDVTVARDRYRLSVILPHKGP